MNGLTEHLQAQGWTDAADIVAEVERFREPALLACYTLPWPPSVNGYWGTVNKGKLAGRKFLTERGRNYRRDVAILLLGKRSAPHGIPLKLHIRCYPPDRRVRDLDNICKSLLDGLVNAKVMRDDEDIWDLRLTREVLSSPPGRVVVEVRQHILAGEKIRSSVEDLVERAIADPVAFVGADYEAPSVERRPLIEAPE